MRVAAAEVAVAAAAAAAGANLFNAEKIELILAYRFLGSPTYLGPSEMLAETRPLIRLINYWSSVQTLRPPATSNKTNLIRY